MAFLTAPPLARLPRAPPPARCPRMGAGTLPRVRAPPARLSPPPPPSSPPLPLPHTNVYLAEMRAAEPLSPVDELRVARRARSGTPHEAVRARDELVRANLRLVVHIAKRVRRARGRGGEEPPPLADLVQEGALGLIRAAEMFDPERGVRFSTYAWMGVQSRVRRAAVAPDGAVVVVPGRVRTAAARLRRFRRERSEEGGCVPSREEEEEVVQGVNLDRVLEAAPHLRSALILDAGVGRKRKEEGRAGTVQDVVPSGQAMPEDVVDRALMKELVLAAIKAHLSPRSASILIAKFGLGAKPPVLSKTLASEHGVSAARVHQIIADALAKLRKMEPGLACFLQYLS